MANTHEGGLKVAIKNKLKDPNYYRHIGAMGGNTQTEKTKKRGFASNRQLAAESGRIWGKLTRRGKAKVKRSTICKDEMQLLMESWSADEIISNWRRYDSKR